MKKRNVPDETGEGDYESGREPNRTTALCRNGSRNSCQADNMGAD